MKTTIKNTSETSVSVEFILDSADLNDARQVALHRIAKDIKVQGFRKGKVPVSIAEKHADPRIIDEETIESAVSKAVSTEFIDKNIQALDRPSIEVKKYVPLETLEFTASAEIMPTVTLGDYRQLKVNIESRKTSESEIDDVLERMRSGMAEKEAVQREAREGDETTIDFIGKKDGVAFDGGTASDYSLTLGSNTFIPGFEEGIIGKKPGDTFDLQLKFPLDYHVDDLKGADVIFTTTLKTINEKKLPELNDDFAKKAGPFKNMSELRQDIERELKNQIERETLDKTKDALVTELINISKVPVPQILVNDQVESLKQDFSQNLMYQGMSIDQYISTQGYKDETEWREKELVPAAEKRVKAGLVLSELSKVEDVQASQDEVDAFIAKFKSGYANNPEVLKQFEDPSVIRELTNRLLTEKTVDKLVEINS